MPGLPDLSGRTALVTGANSGIGLPTARELARYGARVLLACRGAAKGEAAVAHIRERVPGAEVETVQLDLADLASVRALGEELPDRLDGLDLLVNNAGVGMIPRRTTADGFEMQFGTNHLGHFALTGLLLPLLLRRPGARVVTVSSDNHAKGSLDFDDLGAERSYSRNGQYARSKLANLLFTRELQRRADAVGAKLLSVAADPGTTATNIGTAPRWVTALMGLFLQSPDKGAAPSLHAATAADVTGGGCYGPGPKLVTPAENARDEQSAVRLWEISEGLTEVRFTGLAESAR
ncbi:SDR family NAD(P)-dependent oxidoreductase [Streptomyces sp. SB3404]|uniref:SDR family NAD(P)-dependent oxidoreductase n=1 Tax=Streptomyces boncukensis TaxID=2711219 RepID=A0A6G4WYU6_9ACTN|nr:oxidoreductase [Streptomyces boncukensis]NGO70466.1 SDR family NAD(P)-dependent oxidoreductase [Streptomyces boncukensis]